MKVFNALKEQEQGPLIIEQCKLLEQVYHTNTTLAFIITISTVRRDLLKADQGNIWSLVSKHNSLQPLHRTISWPKLWDLAHDHGIQGARSLAAIFKTLTSPIFDIRSCPHCSNTFITRESIFGEHISSAHLSSSLADVISGRPGNFHIGTELKSLYSYTSVISDITGCPVPHHLHSFLFYFTTIFCSMFIPCGRAI